MYYVGTEVFRDGRDVKNRSTPVIVAVYTTQRQQSSFLQPLLFTSPPSIYLLHSLYGNSNMASLRPAAGIENVVVAENSMRLSSNTVIVFKPSESDTRMSLLYSMKEVNVLDQMLSLIIIHQPKYVTTTSICAAPHSTTCSSHFHECILTVVMYRTLNDFISRTEADQQDDLLQVFVNMSISSGCPLRMLHYFISEEFNNQGIANKLAPTSIPAKLIQLYWGTCLLLRAHLVGTHVAHNIAIT